MKKVLIDLNVLLDFLAKREGHEEAATLIALCEKKEIRGYLSSHEVTTLAYFLTERYKSKQNLRTIIGGILDLFTTLPIHETVLRNALRSKITDFEDAVIEQTALKEKLDCIITKNLADFKKGEVRAMTPGEYLSARRR